MRTLRLGVCHSPCKQDSENVCSTITYRMDRATVVVHLKRLRPIAASRAKVPSHDCILTDGVRCAFSPVSCVSVPPELNNALLLDGFLARLSFGRNIVSWSSRETTMLYIGGAGLLLRQNNGLTTTTRKPRRTMKAGNSGCVRGRIRYLKVFNCEVIILAIEI
jgi:hypothetical protein